jgi:hypothetical protein
MGESAPPARWRENWQSVARQKRVPANLTANEQWHMHYIPLPWVFYL